MLGTRLRDIFDSLKEQQRYVVCFSTAVGIPQHYILHCMSTVYDFSITLGIVKCWSKHLKERRKNFV